MRSTSDEVVARSSATGSALDVGHVVRPGSIAEVADALRQSLLWSMPVSVAAAGMPKAGTAGGMVIDLGSLTGMIDIHPDARTATFLGGTTFAAASGELHDVGLSIVGAPDDDSLTLAGAAATGAHGSNPAEPSFSGCIRGITLVTEDGTARIINERFESEVWGSAKLSLGALGVPVAVTVALRPKRRLSLRRHRRDIMSLVAEFDEAREKVDFYRVDWRPQVTDATLTVGWYSDDANPEAFRQVPRDSEPPAIESRQPRQRRSLREFVARRLPFLAPAVSKVASALDRVAPKPAAESSDLLSGAVLEYHLPPARASQAIAGLYELSRAHRGLAAADVRLSLVAGDDAHMSPSYRTNTLSVLVSVPARDADALHEVEDFLIWLGGLPSWQHYSTMTGPEAAFVMPWFSGFRGSRDQLDPHHRMQNQLVTRLLP